MLMNEARAEWANCVIDTFMAKTGTDKEDALSDLLCDLMHYADQEGEDFDSQLERAKAHYVVETGEEADVEY